MKPEGRRRGQWTEACKSNVGLHGHSNRQPGQPTTGLTEKRRHLLWVPADGDLLQLPFRRRRFRKVPDHLFPSPILNINKHRGDEQGLAVRVSNFPLLLACKAQQRLSGSCSKEGKGDVSALSSIALENRRVSTSELCSAQARVDT